PRLAFTVGQFDFHRLRRRDQQRHGLDRPCVRRRAGIHPTRRGARPRTLHELHFHVLHHRGRQRLISVAQRGDDIHLAARGNQSGDPARPPDVARASPPPVPAPGTCPSFFKLSLPPLAVTAARTIATMKVTDVLSFISHAPTSQPITNRARESLRSSPRRFHFSSRIVAMPSTRSFLGL